MNMGPLPIDHLAMDPIFTGVLIGIIK